MEETPEQQNSREEEAETFGKVLEELLHEPFGILGNAWTHQRIADAIGDAPRPVNEKRLRVGGTKTVQNWFRGGRPEPRTLVILVDYVLRLNPSRDPDYAESDEKSGKKPTPRTKEERSYAARRLWQASRYTTPGWCRDSKPCSPARAPGPPPAPAPIKTSMPATTPAPAAIASRSWVRTPGMQAQLRRALQFLRDPDAQAFTAQMFGDADPELETAIVERRDTWLTEHGDAYGAVSALFEAIEDLKSVRSAALNRDQMAAMSRAALELLLLYLMDCYCSEVDAGLSKTNAEEILLVLKTDNPITAALVAEGEHWGKRLGVQFTIHPNPGREPDVRITNYVSVVGGNLTLSLESVPHSQVTN